MCCPFTYTKIVALSLNLFIEPEATLKLGVLYAILNLLMHLNALIKLFVQKHMRHGSSLVLVWNFKFIHPSEWNSSLTNAFTFLLAINILLFLY